KGKHYFQWGGNIQKQYVDDKLNEWEFNDSAGYSLPYTSSTLQLNKVLKGKANFNVTRFSGYLQDNIQFKDSSDFTMQIGLRFNYNNLNNEFLLSPRISFSFIPKRKQDLVFKGAIGLYHQPPFYREMRRYDGSINNNLKAQKSLQFSAGMDYNFTMFNRPARITTEAYYKNMWQVVPYDIDNVRIRYTGENNAKAYAIGLETRLYGELVKDAESWLSFGIMQTKENLTNDAYQKYTLDNNNIPIDSTLINVGWLRRPTDRLITFGMFFQDYLSTNKNFKFYMNALYGSNLPYNIPGSVRYRNALRIEPYIRVDIGISALLLQPEKQNRRSYSPFKNFESIWVSLEAFNLIDRANTISYLLIKDYQNNTFAMPNRLTPRLINLKLIAKW
ncbi:MAG TPA: TonB-dependent receptor, partial [Chitinophagaceae bacterium]|nr:TonB-dependent receptor [Chitinophagaceae bacterium]